MRGNAQRDKKRRTLGRDLKNNHLNLMTGLRGDKRLRKANKEKNLIAWGMMNIKEREI